MIDEVLSVGDYAFQRKSLGKMQDITQGGRTVLFVSHQIDMVRTLCTRCVLLENGCVKMIGPTPEVIEAYMAQPDAEMTGMFEAAEDPERPYQILRGRLLNQMGSVTRQFDVFEPITFEFEYVLREATMGLSVSFLLQRSGEPLLMSFDTDTATDRFETRQPGIYRTQVTLPSPLIKAGQYTIDASVGITYGRVGNSLHRVTNALTFDVDLISKAGSLSSYASQRAGKLALELDWKIEPIAEEQATGKP
jgi:lipopolysaccharide transport system ATP-binding protein